LNSALAEVERLSNKVTELLQESEYYAPPTTKKEEGDKTSGTSMLLGSGSSPVVVSSVRADLALTRSRLEAVVSELL
jgi:hypothetical protein